MKKTYDTNGKPITEVKVKNEEAVTIEPRVKKVQKVSISYTLKSFKGNNDKLFKANVINSEMYDKLEAMRIEATNEHIRKEFGL